MEIKNKKIGIFISLIAISTIIAVVAFQSNDGLGYSNRSREISSTSQNNQNLEDNNITIETNNTEDNTNDSQDTIETHVDEDSANETESKPENISNDESSFPCYAFLIEGYAVDTNQKNMDDANVLVESSLGSIQTIVGPKGGWPSGYWQVDVGILGENYWPSHTNFTVTISTTEYRGIYCDTIESSSLCYLDCGNIVLSKI